MSVDFGTGFVRILPDLTKFTPALVEGVVGAGTAAEARLQGQFQGVAAGAAVASEKASTAVSGAAAKSSESWSAAAQSVRASSENLVASVIATFDEAATASVVAADQIPPAWRRVGISAQEAAAQVRAVPTATEAAATEIAVVLQATAAGIRTAAESISAAFDVAGSEAASASQASAGQVSAAWRDAGAGAGSAFEGEWNASMGAAVEVSSGAAAKVAADFGAAGVAGAAEFETAFTAALAKVSAAGDAAAARLQGSGGIRAGLTGLFTGVLAIGGLEVATRGATDYAEKILEISSAYHIGSQEAARLNAETDIVGSSIEQVLPTFARLTRAAGISGSTIAQALDAWGIGAEKFRNADIEGQLKLLSDGYDAAGKHQKQFISDILGGRGTRIAPLFAQYGELSKIVKTIKFPVPSHADIFAMKEFQVQMGNWIKIAEIKAVSIIIKLKYELTAFLALWALSRLWKLGHDTINLVVKDVGRLAGKIRDAIKYSASWAEKNRALVASQARVAVATDGVAASAEAEGLASTSASRAIEGQAVADAELTGASALTSAQLEEQSLAQGELAVTGAAASHALGPQGLLGNIKLLAAAHPVLAVLAAAGAGYGIGTLLNKTLGISDHLDDLLGKINFLGSRPLDVNIKGIDEAVSQLDKLKDEVGAGTIKYDDFKKAVAEIDKQYDLNLSAQGLWEQGLSRTSRAQDLAAAAAREHADAMKTSTEALDQFNSVMGTTLDLTSKDVMKTAAQAYVDWAKSVADSLNFVTSDLQALSSQNDLTAAGLARHLDLQLREMATFSGNLNTIAADNTAGARAAAQQLANMGTAGYHMAYVIAHATPAVRKHIEDDIGKGLSQSQSEAQKLEQTLVGGFTRIAAAILFATNKAKTWADAMKQASHIKVPGVDLPKSPSVTYPHRAMGGPIEPNVTYEVGEDGPELFRSRTRGDIVPLDHRGRSTPAHAMASEQRINTGSMPMGGGQVELVITNWESGKGYFRWLARDEAAQDKTYQQQVARMRRRR